MKTQDWKEDVRNWYRAYSEEDGLLVLNTQERMIERIEQELAKAKQEGQQEVLDFVSDLSHNAVPGLRIFRHDGSGILFVDEQVRLKFTPSDNDFVPEGGNVSSHLPSDHPFNQLD